MKIISVCDYSTIWGGAFIHHGFEVICIDPKHDKSISAKGSDSGKEVKLPNGCIGLAYTAASALDYCSKLTDVYGVILAPPCTDFSSSGATNWKKKDASGETKKSVQVVLDCLKIVEVTKPKFWVLENPIGRIAKLVPKIGKYKIIFHPHQYAGYLENPEEEAYTKKTLLYGNFNSNLIQKNIPPAQGSKIWNSYGGKSEKTKEARSITPKGFSIAFAQAQLDFPCTQE